MALGKIMRYLLILLDIFLLAYMVRYFVSRIYPIDKPIFWVAAIVEAGLGYLAYLLWMRSLGSKEHRNYRFWSLGAIVLAIALPYLVNLLQVDLLQPASTTDLFFYCTALSLLIYSSFKIKAVQQPRKFKF